MTRASHADVDQMLQNVKFDQALHCLHTQISIKRKKTKLKSTPAKPQMICVRNHIKQTWVNICHIMTM